MWVDMDTQKDDIKFTFMLHDTFTAISGIKQMYFGEHIYYTGQKNFDLWDRSLPTGCIRIRYHSIHSLSDGDSGIYDPSICYWLPEIKCNICARESLKLMIVHPPPSPNSPSYLANSNISKNMLKNGISSSRSLLKKVGSLSRRT